MSQTLEEKKEQILLLLKKHDYLSIKHIRVLVGLGETYVYKVMAQLKPFVRVFTDEGLNVYYLSKEGRAFTASTKVRKRLTTAAHYLIRADAFIYMGKPQTWTNEMRITLPHDDPSPKGKPKKTIVVADAHYTHRVPWLPEMQHTLVEIDNVQKMSENQRKIDKYRVLIAHNVFGGMPRLVWITTTAYRKARLLEMCEGLDVRIYLREDLQ